ncbi:MAG: alpha-galactosidase [Mariniphaga sp.]
MKKVKIKIHVSLSHLLIVLIFTTILGISGSTYGQIPAKTPANISDVRQWVDQQFAKGKTPPFSFVYGGKKSEAFIKNWKYATEKIKGAAPNVEETVYSYTDPQSNLVVKCNVILFNDFPAVEWTLHFYNGSFKNTPMLEKANVIDKSFTSEEKFTFLLRQSKGSNAERNDFQPSDKRLEIGKNIYMTPSGGRSSDNTAFPFFNIGTSTNQGIIVAVGWTGKWFADVLQSDEKTVSLKSGMERMKLTLYPKEEIRTPKICLLFWKGDDQMTGHNLFRQFVLNHHSRKINGTFAEYPLSGSFDYGDPAPCGEYNCLTADYAIAIVNRCKQFKALPELFWLDAGWYTGCGWDKKNGEWWQNVGNWSVDKERFPNGLKPVSDAVHAVGAKFMVWFEPERVRPGTELDKEHPEWLVKLPGNDNFLFDLGNTKARLWLTDHISDMIKKEGIDYYRQDFNFDPMPYWEARNKPDRIGIPEIKHIEGLYAYWDSLLVRFPKLLIDNCASGGRRIDLETTSRSAPLWRTDYQYGEPNGYQCHTYGLNFYLPIHGTAIYKTDSYTFRSGLGGTAVLNWEVTGRESEPIPAIQKRIQDYKELRPYFYGDYYPLTESRNNTSDNVWLAYQLNRTKQSDGIVIAFRRGGSSNETIKTRLHGLESDSVYELFYEDYGLRIQKKGFELMKDFDLTIPQKPASLLIRYKKLM